jgi:LacI family transcriptional regulator
MPQAIFCANDGIATSCMEALAQAGLRVPEDVSVAGFDDTLQARTSLPQLTTVRQPLRAMGARAVEALLAHIGQSVEDSEPIVFPTEVIIRASVCPPSDFPRTIAPSDHGPRPKTRAKTSV